MSADDKDKPGKAPGPESPETPETPETDGDAGDAWDATIFRPRAPEEDSADEAETTPEEVPEEESAEGTPDAAIEEPAPDEASTPPQAPDDEATVFSPAAPAGATDPGVSPEPDDSTVFTAAPPPAATQPPADEATRIATQPPAEPEPLAQPQSPATMAGTTTATGSAIPLGVGTLINNNYEIRAVLKSGGMGAVYRGNEIGTGDPVAIKAIRAELAEDEKAGLLFKREARTLRQLTDEAIVRYYNYVHDANLGRYFLVMEFIEGVPLSEYIAEHGAIPVPAMQTLIKRLTKGLAMAHAKDVVHRDLSPDNVMLPDGDVSQARLIDFGIAKSNVVKEGTMFGQFAGKLKYVAPEQLGAYGGVVTPATDIYGLALLLCAAALGTPLDMGASEFEAVRLRQSIPDLSAVPGELRPLLMHMLEPDPVDRPASMDEVRRELMNPALIPAKYLGGMPPPPALEPTSQGSWPGSAAPAPAAHAPQPGLQVPGASTAAPATATTTAPRSQAPRTSLPPPEPETGGSGGKVLGLLVLLFVAILAGAGWMAWKSGMIGGGGMGETAQTTPDTPPDSPAAAGIPAPDTNTRDGFLAALDTGACTYAARVTAGPKTGIVEGYSASGETFAGLPTAYEEKFGARPEILPREVDPPQCAALDFARALEGRGSQGVSMVLSVDTVESGQAVNATLRAAGDQALWVVLVSPLGGVYNLTGRLSEPVGGQRNLGFGLNLADGSEAQPQLLLAVASNTPLARAAAARDGALASELLPQVLDEIAANGGGASTTLSWLLLTPPTPEPEPAPAPDAAPDGGADGAPPADTPVGENDTPPN